MEVNVADTKKPLMVNAVASTVVVVTRETKEERSAED